MQTTIMLYRVIPPTPVSSRSAPKFGGLCQCSLASTVMDRTAASRVCRVRIWRFLVLLIQGSVSAVRINVLHPLIFFGGLVDAVESYRL